MAKIDDFHPLSRHEWRNWLAENHGKLTVELTRAKPFQLAVNSYVAAHALTTIELLGGALSCDTQ